MRKTDKKIDNQIRATLTEVCATALKQTEGFEWLSHVVNYSSFPKSLRVVCVFDTKDNLKRFVSSDSQHKLNTLIQESLLGAGIAISTKKLADHIVYDSQESCNRDHNGKWADRLAK